MGRVRVRVGLLTLTLTLACVRHVWEADALIEVHACVGGGVMCERRTCWDSDGVTPREGGCKAWHKVCFTGFHTG